MAPKDSAAYDYKYWNNKSNVALPLEVPQETYEKERITKHRKPATRTKSHERNRTKSSMFTMCTSLIFCFGIAILLVIRSAYIAELNFKINDLNEQYEVALKAEKEWNVRLLKSVNLETLEDAALKELGMQYPDVQKSVTYVAVDQTKKIDIRDFRGYYNIADVQKKDFPEIIVDYVGNIAGMLKN